MIKFLVFSLIVLNSVQTYAQDKREFEMKEGDKTYTMKRYYMCFLYKGEHRTHDSLTTAEIQTAHLNRINELAEEGKIQLAGPFGHDGDLRGVLLYDAATKEEAIKLAESDPAIKAGRLRYEVYPWWGAKGTTLK